MLQDIGVIVKQVEDYIRHREEEIAWTEYEISRFRFMILGLEDEDE